MKEEKDEKQNAEEQEEIQQDNNQEQAGKIEDEKENSEAEVPDEKETEVASEEETLKKELEELKDKHLRLTAEFDNYRRRTVKEKMDIIKSGGEEVLKKLLPVIDDFDRAILHLDDAQGIEAVREGIMLIYNKFQNFKDQNGLEEIDAKEKEFDVDLHEALTKIPAPTPELKGKVVDVIEKGYKLNDKVIRFAKVVVGE